MRALLSFALVLVAATPARADEPYFTDESVLAPLPEEAPPPPAAPTLDTFSYVRPQRKHYLRAALEVETVLIVGNVDYLLNTTARGGTLRPGDQRWDLRYDWSIFRDKLTGDDWKLDTNRFDTNYVSHPFAGTLYYQAARSNRLGVVESYGYTLVGALSWEMFGELREEVSINDVIVTSSAGLAIGEATTQLSSFFFRSKKNLRNEILGTLFSPMRAFNDGIDGALPVRSEHLDAAGFDADAWHEFALFAGMGITHQRGADYPEQRFGLELSVKNLPGYHRPVRRDDLFDDGNVAALGFATAISRGRLADSTFHASAVPAGIHLRRGALDGQGRAQGDGAIAGWATSFEYSAHDYERQTRGHLDTMAVLSPAGVAAEYLHQGSPFDVLARFGVAGDFAGITALALDDYRAAHHQDDANLQTVLREHRYYHALGFTFATSLELAREPLRAGAGVSVDTFRGIEGFDEQQATILREIPLSDRRVQLRAWIGARVPAIGLGIELAGVSRNREGRVGDVRTTRSDASLFATTDFVF